MKTGCCFVLVFLLLLLPFPAASARAETGRTLTIVNSVGDSARFEKAAELFHARYPDTKILQRRIDDARVLATEIMAGGEGADIVGLQDSFMTVSAAILLKNGALVDLNRFPEFAALKENCLDIFGFVTIDGRWYAVPEEIEEHLFRVNTTLAEKIGWQIPSGRWSMDDFWELALRVKRMNEETEEHIFVLQDDSFLMPYFFHAYQANHVDAFAGRADYDTQAYINLLTRWKELNENGLVCQSPDRVNPKMRADALLYTCRCPLSVLGEDTCILPPCESDASKYPVYGGVLSINANTPHMEEAVYFMRCYLSPEALERQYALRDGCWLKEGQAASDPLFIETVSDENVTLWSAVLENGAPELYLLDISREQYKTLFPALLEGRISPERFAAVSQQLADMALGE